MTSGTITYAPLGFNGRQDHEDIAHITCPKIRDGREFRRTRRDSTQGFIKPIADLIDALTDLFEGNCLINPADCPIIGRILKEDTVRIPFCCVFECSNRKGEPLVGNAVQIHLFKDGKGSQGKLRNP